jgi:hypothetical protein
MFIKRNCVWLIAATFVVSNLSQARAGGGFMDKVQEGAQYANEAKQVEGTAKQIDEKAEGLFKKKTPADATAATKTTTDVKATEVKTSDASPTSNQTTSSGDATASTDSMDTSK